MIAYRILGIDFCNDDAKIREAYLQKLKEYSPEKFPDEYKTIRKAYEILENQQKRIEYFLFDADQDIDIEEYRRLFIRTDKQMSEKTWNKLCRIYQESR